MIEQSGSTDPEVWIPKFEASVNRDSVEGVKTMRACDHQALQNGFLAQVVAGTPPQPAYLMKIVAEYQGSEIMLGFRGDPVFKLPTGCKAPGLGTKVRGLCHQRVTLVCSKPGDAVGGRLLRCGPVCASSRLLRWALGGL